MADNVVTMPGIMRRELPSCPANESLKSAMEAGLQDVVIVGRNIAGDLQVWCSGGDMDKGIGLLQRGSVYLADAVVENIEPETEG